MGILSQKTYFSVYSNGLPGTDGDPGKPGRGITNITEYYYSATFDKEEGDKKLPAIGNYDKWKTEITNFDATNKYLWNYELINYSDGTTNKPSASMIAVYSKDGRGISSITEWYAITETNSAPYPYPGMDGQHQDWKTIIQIPTIEEPYLWNYEIVNYTEGEDDYFGPICIGVHGKSPYSIELSNDSATIGADVEGNYDETALQNATVTEATVFEGNTDITNKCTFSWDSTTNGVLADNTSKSRKTWFKSISADNASTTLTVKKDGESIGTKTFNVTRVRQGEEGTPAITYVMSASPNSWNKTKNSNSTIVIKVIKYVGDSVQDISSVDSLYIYDGSTYTAIANANGITKTISQSTTFQLKQKVGSDYILLDSETVTAIENGQNGQDIKDFNISTSSYVYTEDENGSIANMDTIVVKAEGKNLGTNLQYKWYLDNSTDVFSNSSYINIGWEELQDKNNLQVNCTCIDSSGKEWKDWLTLSRIKKGKNGLDGITIGLTNPSMTFNVNSEQGMVESTEIIAYVGTTPIVYTTAPGGNTSGWQYTVNGSESSKQYITISNKGVISTKNLTEEIKSIDLVVKVFKNGALQATYNLSIKCTYVKNGVKGDTGDNKVQTYIYFYTTAKTINKPSLTNGALDNGWYTNYNSSNVTSSTPYCFRSVCVVTTSADGKTSTYSNAEEPVLYAAYTSIEGLSYITHAEALRLTNFNTDGFYYGNDGKLYLVASSLVVKDYNKNELLYAAGNTVKLAGWTALYDRLISEDNNIFLSPKGVNGIILKAGNNFKMSTNGVLYLSNAEVSGIIKASNGNIGSWYFEDDKLYTDTAILYSKSGGPSYYSASNSSSKARLAIGSAPTTELKANKQYMDWADSSITFYFDLPAGFNEQSSIEDLNYEVVSINADWLESYIDQQVIDDGKLALTFMRKYDDDDVWVSGSGDVTAVIKYTIASSSEPPFYVLNDGTIKAPSIVFKLNNQIQNGAEIRLDQETYPDTTTLYGALYIESKGRDSKIKITPTSIQLDSTNLKFSGYSTFQGNIWTSGYIESNSTGYFFGDLTTEGDLHVEKTLYAYGEIDCSSSIKVGTLKGKPADNEPSDTIHVLNRMKFGKIGSEMIIAGNTSNALYLGSQSTNNGRIYMEYNPDTKVGVVNVYASTGRFCYNSCLFLDQSQQGTNLTATFGVNGQTSNVKIFGNLYLNGNPITASDRNYKNSIESFNDKYDLLFNLLNPIRHKYNDGNSDRFHTGFIAQEVAEAVLKSGLTLQDFATVCKEIQEDGSEKWGIRYSELVSINTWQIQKLKKHAAAIEEKIALLEEELENLKNSQNSVII